MSMTSTGPINKFNNLAYYKMPKEPQDAAKQDSALEKKVKQIPPDEQVSDLRGTIFPGQSDILITEIAEILTHVKNPLTGEFFLTPDSFAHLWIKEVLLTGSSILELNGQILQALKSFQKIYMGIDTPNGSLGPLECNRILTIYSGIMLTQLTRPHLDEHYLDTTVFNEMPLDMRVKMAQKSPDGSPNPIYVAFQEFLKDRPLPEARKKTTPYTILSKYHLVREQWIMQGKLHQ